MLRRLLFVFSIVFICNASFAENTQTEQNQDNSITKGITEFIQKFQFRFLINYNHAAIWTSDFDEGMLVSNRPIDAGLGFGYGDFYFDFIFALPFTVNEDRSKSLSFETGLDFFPSDWWIKAKYRRYSGFSTTKENSIFVDLWEREVYLSALWMATAKESFSPRAAYFLDRKQESSAGSFIVGGRLQDTKTRDFDSTLVFYQEKHSLTSAWTDMGYSHTWIFNNKMFVNLWGLMGVSVGDERMSNDIIFLPEAIIKGAVGQFRETWSWNIVLETEYQPIIFEDHWEQRVMCSFKTLFVRRF